VKRHEEENKRKKSPKTQLTLALTALCAAT